MNKLLSKHSKIVVVIVCGFFSLPAVLKNSHKQEIKKIHSLFRECIVCREPGSDNNILIYLLCQ